MSDDQARIDLVIETATSNYKSEFAGLNRKELVDILSERMAYYDVHMSILSRALLKMRLEMDHVKKFLPPLEIAE